MPGRTSWAAFAVASTVVSPIEATTAPWLCGASLPVSKVSERSVPDTGPRTRMGSATRAPFPPDVPPGGSGAAGRFPVGNLVGRPHGMGDRQPTRGRLVLTDATGSKSPFLHLPGALQRADQMQERMVRHPLVRMRP